ncbi:MAG: phospholipid carrier-dependent glycosyltransferase [Gammaproteobacteria bacterium]|nr:phospholipid carrier-dependent glycosyltransferase [Gammaproteobacteria bacterium]
MTCWLVYSLHFASNIVREIYPALSLGDHFSFRVDEYAHMHPDLFETNGYGWHIGNNPGASMVAAIPYALARPVIDPIVVAVQNRRAESGEAAPPGYESPWPMAREFYAEAWRRGLDVKLGLAAFVIQALSMAPSSALGVVLMFYLLRFVQRSDRTALWLSLLYAFGTPVFFRTGFLNHNMMLGHIALAGFFLLWNPEDRLRWSTRFRYLLAGLAGGTAVLFDYSGVIFLLALFCYGLVNRYPAGGAVGAVRSGAWYVVGSLGPILLLWFYQWRSFGHPFFPGQHWMPPVEWIELGYQGYGWPQLELLWMLAFDYRFGLFVVAPVLLLALAYPLFERGTGRRIPVPELAFLLGTFVALWVFFSGSNYTRLQFNTGIRYMAPILPFLFLPASALLVRMHRRAVVFVALLSLTISWPLAMYRDVESGYGILNPILRTFIGGFQLPVLNTISQLPGMFGQFFPHGVSPLPLFLLVGVLLWIIWTSRLAGAAVPADSSRHSG